MTSALLSHILFLVGSICLTVGTILNLINHVRAIG